MFILPPSRPRPLDNPCRIPPGAQPPLRRHQVLRGGGLFTAVGLSLASCTTPVDNLTDLDGPIFGSSRPTTFVVAPGDGRVHVRDLAKVARVLRRYKTLDAAERALVKSAVGKRLQGLIALEVQRIEFKYLRQREQIRRLPDRRAATRRLAQLEADIHREAVARVAERLGNLVAVPLKTSDNRSAVAFAKITGTGIEVAKDAGEIDRPLTSLIDGEGVQGAAAGMAAYLNTPPVPVTPAP